MTHMLLNAIQFQACWWACILSVGFGLEKEAILFCLALTGVHVYFSRAPQQELTLALFTTLIGIGVDSALKYFSVIDFLGWSLGPLSPFWLWALWLAFATTLNVSLRFLRRLPVFITAGLGFFLGPWTYYAGSQLGAARLEASPFHLLTLAVIWMVALPVLVLISQRTSPTSEVASQRRA